MVVLILWKLEWMKILFTLTFKGEVFTALLEYNCFFFLSCIICKYYCLNITVNINSFSDLNISVNNTLKYYDSQASLNPWIFFQNIYRAMKYLAIWFPGLQNILRKFIEPSGLASYILNEHCLRKYSSTSKAKKLCNALRRNQFCYAPLIWMFSGRLLISRVQKIHFQSH